MNFNTRFNNELGASNYLLAIDTFSSAASFAIGYKKEIIAMVAFDSTISHTKTMIESIDFIIKKANIGIEEIKGIIVNRGPGSFTGLRISLSFAKALSLANSGFIITFDTFILCSYSKAIPYKYIAALIDAGRGELYCRLFVKELENHIEKSDVYLISPTDLYKLIDINRKEDILLVGNGAIKYKDIFKEAGFANIERGEKFLAPIMLKLFYEGRGEKVSINDLDALYIRKSDAEIKRFK